MIVVTASGVERKRHGKALHTSWPSTAAKEAKEVPSSDDSLYHWILASAAERVGSSLCTDPPTINLSRTGLSSACTLKSPVAMGQVRSSRWWYTLGAADPDPHVGGLDV